MIHADTAAHIYLVCGATDMRKGYDGLAGVVMSEVKGDPLSGHLFVFCNRTRTRIKVLAWDGSGMWVCAKRLDTGSFRWPLDLEAARRVSSAELAMLLEGLDWHQTTSRSWFRR